MSLPEPNDPLTNASKRRSTSLRMMLWCAAVLICAMLVGAWAYGERIWLLIQPPPPPSELVLVEKPPKDERIARLPQDRSRKTVLPQNAAAGWPTLLGPNQDCRSAETGLMLDWPAQGPFEKWRIPVGTGYASPVAIENRVVLPHRVGAEEIIECFDAENGRTLWRQQWPATYNCPYNHSSGPYAAAVIHEGRVYGIGAGGEFYCLNLSNGAVRWRRQLYDEYKVKIEVWPASVSPLIVGDRLILNIGGRETHAGIVALKCDNGETLWTATDDGASCATAVSAKIHDRAFAFVWTAEALVALDPADGRVYWRIPFAANFYEAAHGTAPLVVGDIVVASGYMTGSLCLRIKPDGSYEELYCDKHQKRETRDLLDSQYRNLFYLDGLLCGFSATRKQLRAVDLVSGERRWDWREIRAASTIAVDGAYLMMAENGRLATVDIAPGKGPRLRAITKDPLLKSPVISYPALCNGLVFMRNEQEMVCIDLRRSADK